MFEDELKLISNDNIRKMVEMTLEKIPEYFYEVSASSTGKYHPAYSLGYGGLYRHTVAAVKIAEDLTKLQCFHLSDVSHDCIIAALILHDTMKLGNPRETNTRYDHPILAANLFYDTVKDMRNDVDSNSYIRTIYDAIASHMGQWNISPYDETILPTPEQAFDAQVATMVHLCDYLASRKYITVNF